MLEGGWRVDGCGGGKVEGRWLWWREDGGWMALLEGGWMAAAEGGWRVEGVVEGDGWLWGRRVVVWEEGWLW